jgi:predicted secreted protein with PEFG-CTERM motif
MPKLKFIIFIILTSLLIPHSEVFGHGFGIDTISSADIQGKKISISVELPAYLDEDNDKQITITAIDDKTKEHAKNVTFLIGLFHENNMIFRNYFFASDGILQISVNPTKDQEITIHGQQDSLLGAWYGTKENPIEINGPIFESGGLYNFEIEIRTIDTPTNIIEDSEVYTANLSIIETLDFPQKDIQNNDIQFKIKSYFDKISNFKYDPASKQITFEMPFDWSEKQISHIPFVHEEVHVPKDFAEFFSPSYTGTVNGIDLFKDSITIDDYTEQNERIIHFVLLQDHLKFLKSQLTKSGNTLPDKMVFTLSANENFNFPLTAFTKSEDFQVDLSWDPIKIEPGQETTFVFTIRDGKTEEPLRHSEYTFVLVQNDHEIYRTKGIAKVGGEAETYRFTDEQTGPTIIRFENIRNTNQETEFGIVVTPEFSTISIFILFSALFVIVLASKNYLSKSNLKINL